MVEIFLLEQLAAFAKWGTLSQAAAELGITQPALSHSMKKLEESSGKVTELSERLEKLRVQNGEGDGE